MWHVRRAGAMALALLVGLGSSLAEGTDIARSVPTESVVSELSRAAAHSAAGHPEVHLGDKLPLASVAPFALLLLSIAVLPLLAPHWWEKNSNKAVVSALLAVPTALYLVFAWGEQGLHELEHPLMEYVSFILLLGSLFVVSGGIYLQGSLAGTPLVNTAILAFGGAIASFVGTTGASMLLIRPLLRANASRQRRAHIVVFFIFVVSNCGGLLTPLGDPPLFLGFLKGVPFEWTFNLWPQWLLVNLALLAVFHVWDQVALNREEAERPGSQLEQLLAHEPLRIRGGHNFLFLAGIVATIYSAGRFAWPWGVSESLMLAIAVLAYVSTSREVRAGNRFSFHPINEVAVLFAGIFVTMVPALLILNAKGDQLGINQPSEFFWATGLLSAFLDNAPTYLTFAATACGLKGVPLEGNYLARFIALPPATGAEIILAAISTGAVFMGAMTYIGNGPNFMVKAIAEENGVRMPSFFGYLLYSSVILLPLFVLVTFIFFA